MAAAVDNGDGAPPPEPPSALQRGAVVVAAAGGTQLIWHPLNLAKVHRQVRPDEYRRGVLRTLVEQVRVREGSSAPFAAAPPAAAAATGTTATAATGAAPSAAGAAAGLATTTTSSSGTGSAAAAGAPAPAPAPAPAAAAAGRPRWEVRRGWLALSAGLHRQMLFGGVRLSAYDSLLQQWARREEQARQHEMAQQRQRKRGRASPSTSTSSSDSRTTTTATQTSTTHPAAAQRRRWETTARLEVPLTVRVFAGVLGGVMGSMASNASEAVMTRQIRDGWQATRSQNLWSAYGRAWQARAFGAGMATNVVRTACSNTAELVGYDVARGAIERDLTKYGVAAQDSRWTESAVIVSSAVCASVINILITNPMDVIKTLRMCSPEASASQLAADLWRRGGLRAFYRGATANFAFCTSISGTFFLFLEWMRAAT